MRYLGGNFLIINLKKIDVSFDRLLPRNFICALSTYFLVLANHNDASHILLFDVHIAAWPLHDPIVFLRQ